MDGCGRWTPTTGKSAWETRVSPENMAYTITMAPRVIKGGKVIIGVSGGEYGVRGFFAAFDAETGKQAWNFYTVPGDPSKPFEQPGARRSRQDLERRMVEDRRRRAGLERHGLRSR